jgi:hypothetical protein
LAKTKNIKEKLRTSLSCGKTPLREWSNSSLKKWPNKKFFFLILEKKKAPSLTESQASLD